MLLHILEGVLDVLSKLLVILHKGKLLSLRKITLLNWIDIPSETAF